MREHEYRTPGQGMELKEQRVRNPVTNMTLIFDGGAGCFQRSYISCEINFALLIVLVVKSTV